MTLPVTFSAAFIAICVVLVALIALGAWYLITIARRLNELHVRVDASRANLLSALDKREAVAQALDPHSGTVDQAQTLAQRADAEYEFISRLATDVLSNSVYLSADTRVGLAIRFYNEAVVDLRNLRVQWIVRLFRLQGGAPWPDFYESLGTSVTR